MDKHDRGELIKLQTEVKNNTKQLEKIITNDLPHLYKRVYQILGSLKVLIPLTVALLGLVVGLYFIS